MTTYTLDPDFVRKLDDLIAYLDEAIAGATRLPEKEINP